MKSSSSRRTGDGKVANLQLTEAKEHTIELRCLMSAYSAGQAFDLRCEVREKLIDFLQKEHPEALPTQRNEVALNEVALADNSAGPGKRQRKALTAIAAPRAPLLCLQMPCR